MKKIISIVLQFIVFVVLTVLTQIGGFIYLINLFITRNWKSKFKKISSFIILYLFISQILTPFIAPVFGREKVKHTKIIKPTNYMTVLLNRNYVIPQMNDLLKATELKLKNSDVVINYLDANFPFFDGFPLIPHLSHNDGKKLDISFIYENKKGEISIQQKSFSGYGIYVRPKKSEFNQNKYCKSKGHFQYDFSKYLSFGEVNKELVYSEKGTALLVSKILKSKLLGKMFIEPHLKNRLNFSDSRIRFHGCGAVRHDDHIHIQLK